MLRFMVLNGAGLRYKKRLETIYKDRDPSKVRAARVYSLLKISILDHLWSRYTSSLGGNLLADFFEYRNAGKKHVAGPEFALYTLLQT